MRRVRCGESMNRRFPLAEPHSSLVTYISYDMLGDDPPMISQTTSPLIIAQTRLRRTKIFPLRWKLLIITSLVAALFNAGGLRALAYWTEAGTTPAGVSNPAAVSYYAIFRVTIIPLVIIALACVFVYRHTARRRKLQAALTALFAIVLTLGALFAARMVLNF